MPESTPASASVPAAGASTEEVPIEEAGRGPDPWPARCALVAAAGLVVGGITYGAVEVADALSPSTPVASSESADTAAGDSEESERRPVSLLPDSGEEEEEEEAEQDEGAGGTGGSGDSRAPSDLAGEEVSGGPRNSAGDTAPEGAADPRGEILDELLNSPRPRPPMEPLMDQEDVDAEREAAEAEVEPEVVEPEPEDHDEFHGGYYGD